MKIVYLPITELAHYENNARTHSDEQIEQIAASITEFGFNNPILIDDKDTIIAGHGRILAAKKIGMDTVPTIKLAHLTKTQKKAYILADNRIALNAGWSPELLKLEFEALLQDDFDLALTGFGSDEINALLNPETEGHCDPDDVPAITDTPITKLGDVWVLGNHRLLCGDATMIDDVEKLMAGEKADMVFTDPPYGINYSGRGKKTSNKILNDNIDPTEFYNLMSDVTERYIWGRIENYLHLMVKPRDVIIWKKNNFGMGNGYRGQYEMCFYYGSFKGSDSDVWEVDKDINYVHPTQKPVALAERAIKNTNPKNVIDFFGGSGSTLIACEKTNRHCFMMELSPQYCDVIVKRWQKFTQRQAILESTQQGFDEVANGKTREAGLDTNP